MTTSKDAILKKLRQHKAPVVEEPLPDSGPWIQFDDPVKQFEELVQSVGGQTVRVANEQSLCAALDNLSHYQQANRICAINVPLAKANVDLSAIEDPHDLADVDFVAVRGSIGVAENGAIWISAAHINHRVSLFITLHLAIVVQAGQIVHHMHEAYDRIELPRPGYGVFISGPSKTADIEQSLVIGAHGPRSLTVFVVDT